MINLPKLGSCLGEANQLFKSEFNDRIAAALLKLDSYLIVESKLDAKFNQSEQLMIKRIEKVKAEIQKMS